MPRLRVGPKHLRISVAGQNVTIDKEVSPITPFCAADYYGQEMNGMYWSGLGECGEECDLKTRDECVDSWDEVSRNHNVTACESVKHCDSFENVFKAANGTQAPIDSCTVISRHDEYCVPCPGGFVIGGLD